MSQGSRTERIADQIRAELGDLLEREVKDPGIGFTTLTRVWVSPDLSLARVYYTCLGDEQARRQADRALRRAAPFLRRRLGGRLRLKRLPSLEFRYDESVGQLERIERLLHEIHEAEPTETNEDVENEPGDES